MKDFGHGGDIFVMDETERETFLDFSVNINPLGMSPKGRAALAEFFSRETLRYPDIECRDLKKAIAAHDGVPAEGIVCGNGATELMYALMRVLKPSAVYVPAPCFSEYARAAAAEKIPAVSYSLDKDHDFAVTNWDFLQNLPQGCVLYAGHPNNPDGRLLSETDFLRLSDAAKKAEGQFIIDESFIDFLDGNLSYRTKISEFPHVIVITSLTKFYAVPGLRIGCTFSTRETAEKVSAALCPWNVNGPVQLYIGVALSDREYIEETKKFVREESVRLRRALTSVPHIKIYPGTVNFVLLSLTNGRDAAWLQKKLLPHKIFIRQCGNYEGLDDTFFRVAVRTTEENEKLLHTLSEVLSC